MSRRYWMRFIRFIWPCTSAQQVIDKAVKGPINPKTGGEPSVEPKRIEGQTQTLEAQCARVAQEDAQDRRVHVEVEMAIDVVQRQAACAELFKLGVDLGAQLFAQLALKKITPAASNGVILKTSIGAHEARNLFRRQSRVAAEQG